MLLIGIDIVKNLLCIFTMKTIRLKFFYYNYLKHLLQYTICYTTGRKHLKKSSLFNTFLGNFQKKIFLVTNTDVAFSYIDNVFYQLCKEE